MSVSEDDVRKVARLARIRVPDEELAALSTELGSILGWIEQLNAVDVSAVPPDGFCCWDSLGTSC